METETIEVYTFSIREKRAKESKSPLARMAVPI